MGACARARVVSIQYSVKLIRGNGVTLRTQKVIQGDDNGHVGRPCEASLAPPCPELFCELRGLCRHSYFGPRTFGRSEKTMVAVKIHTEFFVCVYYCRTYYKAVRGGVEVTWWRVRVPGQ